MKAEGESSSERLCRFVLRLWVYLLNNVKTNSKTFTIGSFSEPSKQESSIKVWDVFSTKAKRNKIRSVLVV